MIEQDIRRLMKEQNPYKPHGPDNSYYCCCSKKSIDTLNRISLEENFVAIEWKRIKFVVVFKRGDRKIF